MLPSNKLLCVTKLLIDLMIKSKCGTMVKKKEIQLRTKYLNLKEMHGIAVVNFLFSLH